MPYTPPAPKDIKARFPEFADVPDAAVEFAIEFAKRGADSSWLEADYALAVSCLTAHLLVAGGALADDPQEATTVGPLVSESLGDASRSWAAKASVVGVQGMAAELATTTYGQWYLRLLSCNQPAVALC